MISTIYFLLFAIILFSLSAYVITMSSNLVSPEFGFKQDQDLKMEDSKIKINHLKSYGKAKKESAKVNHTLENSKTVDVDLEIKKQSRQLKRNLRTLNYIFLLEARPNMIKDQERLEEISNLKESLQRQIIRNTKLLNNYRQAQ